jgi:hypothetical protein
MQLSSEIIEEYQKCMKNRKKVLQHNSKIKKRARVINAIFALFFLCIPIAYYKPIYIPGIYGDQLETTVQSEYIHLVSTGWTNIRDIESYLNEYRETKGYSYLILGDEIYKIHEIPSILQRHPQWGFLFTPAFYVINTAITMIKRATHSCVSMIVLLQDSGNGIFRIEQIGDVLGNGVWVISLHMLYWILVKLYNICITSPFDTDGNHNHNNKELTQASRWVFIPNQNNEDEDEEDDSPKLIMFQEVVNVINSPIEMENLPLFHEYIYNAYTLITQSQPKHE